MDWIKKNYDRFALLLLAVALLASSAYMVLCVNGFATRYEPVLASVTHGKKVALLETEPLERAKQALAKPAEWGVHAGLLFVSRKYVVGKNATTKENVLIDPFEPGSTPLHPPVPNEWFLKSGLETAILESDALTQDPDKDGFSNLDEYLGKTDPLNPQSHPGYLTKLRLKKFIKVPFRLKFEAYDEGSFQINTIDVRQPTQFVKLGEMIAGTKYKALKFEKKSVLNPNTGVDRDVSELTVEHSESGLQVVLVVGTESNSPDQYARFAFLWDGTEFTVKKLQTFSLKPESGVVYKLIDIKDNEALINNVKTDGDPIKVPHTEEPPR